MGWIYIGFAGGFEILFTTLMRYTEGFTRIWPTAGTLAAAAASLYFIARATEFVPLGTAYAAWGAIGGVGTVLIGIAYFDEPVTFWRVVFLTTLIASTVGLKLVDN